MKKNFVLSVVAVAGLTVGLASCNCGAPKAHLSNDLDSVAYAFGVMQGAQFAAVADEGMLIPEKQIDLDEFLAGFLTAVRRDSSALKMSPEEADTYLRGYFETVRQEQMAKMRAEVETNKAEGRAFMESNASNDGVVTTASGLQYKVVTKGTGATPKEADQVKVNYKGTLLDGTVFDSNEGRDAVSFPVNGVVPGFKEGLMLMPAGSKYILWMPSDLAYGDRGNAGIPGGSTLCFEVEVVEVVPAKK